MKKLIALLLALVMVLSLFAGCSSANAPAEEAAAPAENAAAAEETAEPAEEAAPAEEGPKYDENAVLTWYFMGDAGADDEMVFEKANELIKAELGFTVNFIPVGSGEYSDKIKLAINGGDDWDICWTSNWRNDIVQNVNNGVFLPLDDLIAEHPDLVAAIPESLWTVGMINGTTYGITCQQNCAKCCSVSVPVDYSELFDEKTVGGVEKYSDFTDYMAAVAEEHPGTLTTSCVQNWGTIQFLWNWERIGGSGCATIDMTADKLEAFNAFATDEFYDMCKARWEWGQNDICLPGVANKEQSEWNQWEKPLEVSTYNPGYVNDTKTGTAGFDIVMKRQSDAWVSFGSVASTMMAVNAETEYPEECVAFLAFLNTSTELMNLLTFGIEGVHYNLNEDGKVVRVPNCGYGNQGWRIGNTFILTLEESQSDSFVSDTVAYQNSAKASPLGDFSPDLSSVELELTNMQSVYDEYCTGKFDQGLSEDFEADWAAFQEKYEAAGASKVVAEMQAQLDAYFGQ